MLRPAIALACLLTLLSACGDGDDDTGGGAAAAPELAADLSVVARPDGPDGPVRRRTIRCEELGPGARDAVCRHLTAERLAPVPPATACAEIYGGPATARVTGTLRGERIDARFSRVNACEIERWDRNVDLLGPPGRVL
jgi:hypothetical protein